MHNGRATAIERERARAGEFCHILNTESEFNLFDHSNKYFFYKSYSQLRHHINLPFETFSIVLGPEIGFGCWLKRKLSNVYLSIFAYVCVYVCVGVYVYLCAKFSSQFPSHCRPCHVLRPKRKTLLLNFSAFDALKFICSTTTWQIVYQCHFHSMSIKRLQCNLFFIPSAEKWPN